MNLTHKELRMLARWMRRLGDEVHGVEEDPANRVANYLDAQAAAMEAAAAPPQPAAVEPRCDRCRWFLDASAACVRFPPSRPQMRADLAWEYPLVKPSDYCGEFSPLEVTP